MASHQIQRAADYSAALRSRVAPVIMKVNSTENCASSTFAGVKEAGLSQPISPKSALPIMVAFKSPESAFIVNRDRTSYATIQTHSFQLVLHAQSNYLLSVTECTGPKPLPPCRINGAHRPRLATPSRSLRWRIVSRCAWRRASAGGSVCRY
jgi:hypothetical protein